MVPHATKQHPLLRRLPLLYSLITLAIAACLLWYWTRSRRDAIHGFDESSSPRSIFRDEVVPCRGPRGSDLLPRHDDLFQKTTVSDAPPPYAGSYKELGLDLTYTTAEDRYGLYGFGEILAHREHEKVNWDNGNWAALQNECMSRNVREGLDFKEISSDRRMSLPPKTSILFPPSWYIPTYSPRGKLTTGRTAIVVRGYSTFDFKDEDLWNLRSLITETALRYGGRYSVYLLVQARGEGNVMENATYYEEVIQTIPLEFRSMTVLWDKDHLLETWYARVEESRLGWQMEQALQLFARFFDEFDHYWQIELDIRFTGDAGRLLDSLEHFARQEPRKQARERSSFFFIPQVHKTYANFINMVDTALKGGSSFYHGIPIPDFPQIGPEPPTSAEHDHFTWGVGEEADLILLSGTMNITLNIGWVYKFWFDGFELGMKTPRVASAPAVSRCSWNLLNAIHESQFWHGMRIGSEATPVSWALWHNLKVSRPPFPIFGEFAHEYTPEQIDVHLNGGPPSPEHDGMGWGQNVYGHQMGQQSGIENLGPTWRWDQGYPGNLMDAWTSNDVERVSKEDSDVKALQIRDGKVYMPILMMHPVKT